MYYSRLGCLPAFSDMDYTFWFPDKLIGVLKPQNKCLFRSILFYFFTILQKYTVFTKYIAKLTLYCEMKWRLDTEVPKAPFRTAVG
jgi:hypothetical protein